MNPRVLGVVLGTFLVLLAGIGLLSAGVPTIYCPLPLLTVFPAFALWWLHLQVIGILVPALIFFLWNPTLIARQEAKVPKRTIGLIVVLSILTIVYFATGWKDGLHYQGAHQTIAVCGINALWLAALWWAVVHAWRRPSFRANLLSHWLLFASLGWYAFPYLGELP